MTTGNHHPVELQERPVTQVRDQLGEKLPAYRPERLSDREWHVLVAHIREHASYTQIAHELGVTRSWVQQLATRAARKLR